VRQERLIVELFGGDALGIGSVEIKVGVGLRSPLNLNVFVDEVTIEMGEEGVFESGGSVDPKGRFGAEHGDVGQDFSLDVADERLATAAGGESLEVVGAESVKKPDAVGASEFKLRTVEEGEEHGETGTRLGVKGYGRLSLKTSNSATAYFSP
jgi:hypothetical protein